MSLVALIGIYVVVTVVVTALFLRLPKDARVRYRLGLGADGTTSRVFGLVGYLTIADIFLVGGLLAPNLRMAAIGGLLFTGLAGWNSARNAL